MSGLLASLNHKRERSDRFSLDPVMTSSGARRADTNLAATAWRRPTGSIMASVLQRRPGEAARNDTVNLGADRPGDRRGLRTDSSIPGRCFLIGLAGSVHLAAIDHRARRNATDA